MGGKKESSSGSSTTVVNQSSTPTPTPEEIERNRLLLEQQKAIQPSETRNMLSGLDLQNLLLSGQPLPGYLGGLPGGISESVTQDMVNKSINDINVGSQASGLLDSGVNRSIAARTSGDIRNSAAQFNLNNLQQLLNIAVGGQAQPFQAPVAYSGQLGQALAGLRTTNNSSTSTGSYSGVTRTRDPFGGFSGSFGIPGFASLGFGGR